MTSAEIIVDQYDNFGYDFYAMQVREFTQCGAKWWDGAVGELNRVAVIGYTPIGAEHQDIRIVKVPRETTDARQHGRAEVAILRLLAETVPAPGFEIPAVDRVEESSYEIEGDKRDLFYFVLTPVHGRVLDRPDVLSRDEIRELGRATARIAMWEENIELDTFRRDIDGQFGERWDWPSYFAALDFSDSDYPSLSVAASKMRMLRDEYYPTNVFYGKYVQVIHGDLRLPNLTLSGSPGSRVVRGVHDWGAARIGSRVEECRSLWEAGITAIDAANSEFAAHNRPMVDPEEIHFWLVGRFVVALIKQLHDGIPVSKRYLRARSIVEGDFPELNWSELPNVVPLESYYASEGGGSAFKPNFNGVPGLVNV